MKVSWTREDEVQVSALAAVNMVKVNQDARKQDRSEGGMMQEDLLYLQVIRVGISMSSEAW